MIKYYLTNKAVQDLEDIWDYTVDEWSEQQAERYYKMLIDTFHEITQNPEIGKKYTEISLNLFGLRTGKHIIFYRRINSDTIEITRILHDMMDLKRRIKE